MSDYDERCHHHDTTIGYNNSSNIEIYTISPYSITFSASWTYI